MACWLREGPWLLGALCGLAAAMEVDEVDALAGPLARPGPVDGPRLLAERLVAVDGAEPVDGQGPLAGDGEEPPPVEGAAARQRRQLQYEVLEEKSFHHTALPSRAEHPLPLSDLIRAAARLWAVERQEVLGEFRSPQQTLHGCRTVARCLRHEACEVFWRFTGHWNMEQDAFRVLVDKSIGGHSEAARVARNPQRQERRSCQPTVEERARVLRACDTLAQQGLPVTASGVSVLLGEERVAGHAVVEIVKWRRHKFGASTEAFYASMQSFEAFTNERRGDASTLKFVKVTATATDFRWVAAVTPFLDLLASLNAARRLGTLCVTADYTFGLCHMGFSYALINAVVWRRLGGRNRRSAWPLVVMCSPRERSMCYKQGFEVLLSELARRQLPVPAQCH